MVLGIQWTVSQRKTFLIKKLINRITISQKMTELTERQSLG